MSFLIHPIEERVMHNPGQGNSEWTPEILMPLSINCAAMCANG